jgi:hypothetical protein
MVDFERLGFRCFFGNLAAPKKLIKKNNSSPRGVGVGVGAFFLMCLPQLLAPPFAIISIENCVYYGQHFGTQKS